ncbi:chromate transporter, partial [Oleiphilus sp. HI0043]|uniref:chromate transporter n=3 Tax=Oleiphilus TaxID=141450 RepID=UPI000AEF480C
MKNAISLFTQFFILGCTSFGGPAAHLGYFRKTFVENKKWISESSYSQLIALSQFLPGPGSSQVGFAIGLHRMGLLGGVLAFVGFTLPSFLIMLLVAVGLT